jgi:glycosyltransferase involved in cell wall biosynthesis
MNITYLASPGLHLPSRSARSIHVMRMCEAFSLLGHDVKLIAVKTENHNPKALLKYYGVSNEFEISPIKLSAIKGKTLFFSVEQGRAAKKSKSDLVVSRSAPAAAVSAMLGLRTVYDSHGPVWLNNRIDEFSYKILKNNKNLLRMTTNSIALKKMYEDADMLPHCGISVAHNGSHCNDLNELPNSWPGRENHIQVGYMGHLYPGRGIETIIDASKRLSAIDFHVVGGMQPDIQFWKQRANLGNLFFHGFILPSDIHKFRNKCDILLAPYKGDGVAVFGGTGDSSKYMNPIKLLEYMSSKKAIICSNLEILKEVIDDSACLFVDPNRSEEWVNAIIRLTDVELRNRLADNAYKIFKERFTWKHRAIKLLPSAI